MHISRLALDHYRSWDHCVLDFEPGINILQGSNGLGKTNIVEAVEMLSTGSSHRTSSSLPLVEKGHPSATVRANVEDAGEQRTYEITIAARGANRARVDGGKSQYMRDIVGLVPSVSFTPEDQRLVSGDPATRRNFLNQAASLLLPRYAQSLQQFTHVAKQRAALLKQLSDGSGIDPEYGRQAVLSGLEVWTGQFIALGVQLTKDRNDVIGLLREPFTRIYASLAGEEEQADLVYEPSFDEVLLFDEPAAEISRHFQRIYPGEVARGQNLIGPQRDDLTLRLNDMPAREFASNGEMWTMALALKMALYEVVSAQRDVKPIVILDDVFAQLDESRRGQILDFARRQDQVLITVAAASDIPQGEAHVIDVAALRAQSQETDGDIAAMAAMLAAGRGAQSQGIEAESNAETTNLRTAEPRPTQTAGRSVRPHQRPCRAAQGTRGMRAQGVGKLRQTRTRSGNRRQPVQSAGIERRMDTPPQNGADARPLGPGGGRGEREALLPRQPARRRADDTLRQPGLDHHPVVYDAVADGHHPQETRRSDHQ